MVAMNVVKTVTVVGRQQGVEQVTAALGAQEGAMSRLLAAVAANDRATLSAGRVLERHSMALDQNYRGAQKLAAITGDLNRAQAQGLVTTDRVNDLLALAAAQYDATTREMTRMKGEADALRAKLNPLGAAQGNLTNELDRYSRMAAAGVITTQELAAATALAQRHYDDLAASMQKASAASQIVSGGFTAGQIADLRRRQAEETSKAANDHAQRQSSAFLGVDRPALPARESAAVFEEAAKADEQRSREIASLRGQIDPLGAAQGRLNAELARYADLARNGYISTQELSAAQALAQRQFTATATSIAAQEHAARSAAGGWQYFSTTGLRDLQNETASKRLTDMGASAAVAGKGARLATHEMVNLSYQINDIGTMLAMGQSPFMILASQGGQVAQIFATMDKTSRSAVMGFVKNPWVLAATGLVAAAGAAYLFFRNTETSAQKVDAVFKGHAETLREIKALYGEIGQGIKDVADESSRVLQSQAEAQLQRKRTELAAQTNTFLSGVGAGTYETPVSDPLGGFTGQTTTSDDRLKSRYAGFADLIEQLRQQSREGRVDILQFREAVERRGSGNSALRSMANELLEATSSAGQLQREMPGLVASIDALNRSASGNPFASYSEGMGKLLDMVPRLKAAADNAKLGDDIERALSFAQGRANARVATKEISRSQADAEIAYAERIAREAQANREAGRASALSPSAAMRTDHDLEMRAIRARTAQERADLAAARKERELAGRTDISDADRGLEIERARTLELTRAKHDLAEADRERGMAVAGQFAAVRAELAMSGASIASIEAERFRREKLAEVERLALTNGEGWAKRQRAAINDLANEWGRLQETVARSAAAQDVAFERAQALRSDGDRRRYSDLRSRNLLQNGEIADPETRQLSDDMRATDTLRAQIDLTRSLAFERQQLRRPEDERAIYSEMRGAGLLDESGEISGAYNQAIAEQMRWNKTIEDGQKAVQGLGRELIDAAKAGDVQGMINAPAKRAEEFFTDRIAKGFDNSIQTMMADLAGEGPLADMFAKSTPLGSSVANPMFVSIVGGAGLPGLAGGAANDVLGAVKVNGPGGITRAPLNDNTPALSNRIASALDPRDRAAREAAYAGLEGKSFGGLRTSGTANVSGLNPVFRQRLTALQSQTDKEIGPGLSVFSGYRSVEHQARLYAEDIRKNGGRPSGYVAKPGGSMHQYGEAADLAWNGRSLRHAPPAVTSRIHEMAAENRLRFPMNNPNRRPYEPWHVEPVGGRRQGGRLTNDPTIALPEQRVSAAQPTAQLQTSLSQLQTASQQAATAIPAMTQNAAQAASGLGGLGQQASGLGGLFQNLLGMGGAPMGGAGAGAGGGMGGGILSMLMTAFGLPGFSHGGPTGSTGGIVHPNEYVVNAPTTRAMGGPDGVERALREQPIAMPMPVPIAVPAALPAANQNAPKTEVHVHNNGSGKVSTQETTDSRGNRRVDVVVDEMQANAAIKPGSATARANQTAYGLSPALKRR